MNKATPKYVIVKDKIKRAIKNREIVDKLPGERVLAKEFGFSYMTIRKAIDNLVVEGVLYKLPTKGTFVAKGKKAKKETKVIGYYLDSTIAAGLTSPYYSLMFNALEKKASRHGYSLLYFSDVGDAHSPKHIKKVDGVIASCFPRNENIIHNINNHVPVVAIDNSSSDKTIPSVIIDNYNAVLNSINYLCSIGHKRIGFMTGLHDSDVGKNRIAGYISGLQNHGIEIEDELIYKGNYSFESGSEGAEYYLSLKNPPTAVMCANDAMAISVISKALKYNLNVPKDISVVGFDDITVASQISPALTTVAAPVKDIADKAIDMLIKSIKSEETERQHIALSAELIVRGSCTGIKNSVAA